MWWGWVFVVCGMSRCFLMFVVLLVCGCGKSDGDAVPDDASAFERVEAQKKPLRALGMLKYLGLIKEESWSEAKPMLVREVKEHGASRYMLSTRDGKPVRMVTLICKGDGESNPVVQTVELVVGQEKRVYQYRDGGYKRMQ